MLDGKLSKAQPEQEHIVPKMLYFVLSQKHIYLKGCLTPIPTNGLKSNQVLFI